MSKWSLPPLSYVSVTRKPKDQTPGAASRASPGRKQQKQKPEVCMNAPQHWSGDGGTVPPDSPKCLQTAADSASQDGTWSFLGQYFPTSVKTDHFEEQAPCSTAFSRVSSWRVKLDQKFLYKYLETSLRIAAASVEPDVEAWILQIEVKHPNSVVMFILSSFIIIKIF